MFARFAPDLDAWLRLAPESTRRAAVRHALRRVVERFDIAHDRVVALLLGAVETGAPMGDGAPQEAVTARLYEVCGAEAAPTSPIDQSRRMARMALVGALAQPDWSHEPLKEPWCAYEALGEEWPAIRAELSALVRSAPA